MTIIQPGDRERFVAAARGLVEGRGRLLFLVLFGSTLYGTRVEGRSDLDVRGVYAPFDAPGTVEDCRRQPGLHASTAGRDRRSGEGDVDMDLQPLERWLCRGLPHAATGPLDLLFAPSNPSCVLFRDPALDPVFEKPLRAVDLRASRALVDYCLSQGNTYGMEGTRFGALHRVRLALLRLVGEKGPGERGRLAPWASFLAREAKAPLYCVADDRGALTLAEQSHEPTTRLGELLTRVERKLAGHLERVEAARRNEGVDFKALSHAVRALRQHEELLVRGRVTFPLACADELVAVKKGLLPFAEVERIIAGGLARVASLRAVSPLVAIQSPPDREELLALARSVRGRMG